MVQTYVSEGDFGRVDDISTVSPEHRVWLVLQNKNNVRRNVGGRLVPLLGKGDLRPLLPPLFYLHLQDLVLRSRRPPVGVQPLVGDLHLLDATREHFFQGHMEVMNHGGVLTFGQTRATVTSHGGQPTAEGARETTQPTATHPKVGKRVICVHVLMQAPSVTAKELVKWVTSTKEFCKDCMWVTLESVVEGTGTTASWASSPLQT